MPVLITSLFERRITPPSPRGTGSAVSAWLCGSIGLFYLTMLVREPVHGMQGLLERQRFCGSPAQKMAESDLPQPRTSPERPLRPAFAASAHERWVQAIFLGTRLGLRKRPIGRTRSTACASVIARARYLRPQAYTSLWPVLMSAKREYRLFTRSSGRGLRRV